MQVQVRVGRRRRLTGISICGLAVVAVALSACSSGADNSGASGSGTNTPSASAAAVKLDITPGSDQVNPATPVVVKASGGTLANVVMTNSAKGNQVKGSLSADKKSWSTGEPLAYGATYSLVVDAVNSAGKQDEQKSTITTLTPKSQSYPAFIPAPTDSTFGVGQIIGVTFDQDVADQAAVEKALSVTSTPSQPGSWYWMDKRTVHYRPKDYWQAGTTVTLNAKLYGVDMGNGVYGQTDRTATYKIHDSWIAKADGNTKQMQIFHNGQMVKSLPVSLGKDSTPTHVGPHVISDKQQQVVMDSCSFGDCPPSPTAYKATEYWDERISNDGEFVHENPGTVAQQGNVNVSHGCINLSPENAQWFFNTFNLGDVVEVANSGGPQLPVWDTYGDWELTWAQWQAGSALHS